VRRERDEDQGREKEEKFSCGGQNNEPLEVPPTSQDIGLWV